MVHRLIVIALFIGLIISVAGCRTAPFDVKPRVEVAPAKIARTAANQELELRAQLLDEDEITSLFDGNLVLAGIIPVRILLTNNGSQPLAAEQINFQLFDGQGKRLASTKAKDALTKMVKYYGVRYYNPTFYDEMKTRFISHSLPLTSMIAPGESRQGLVYFKQDKEQPVPAGLRIVLGKNKKINNDLAITLN